MTLQAQVLISIGAAVAIAPTGLTGMQHADGEILAAMDFALGDERTVRVDPGNPALIPEVTQNSEGLFVHLLNWNEAEPVSDVRVSLRLPDGPATASARIISPLASALMR
mgnify:CR=1 FL=1